MRAPAPLLLLTVAACNALVIPPPGVDEPDAGAADSGSAAHDAGTPEDSGTPPVDSGTPPEDSGTPGTDAGSGTHYLIQLRAYYFAYPDAGPFVETPNLTTTLSVGDTIDWVWTSDFSQGESCNVVSAAGAYTGQNLYSCVSNPATNPMLDSGEQMYPFTFSFTFTTPGSYTYVCVDHCGDDSAMWGTVVVQ